MLVAVRGIGWRWSSWSECLFPLGQSSTLRGEEIALIVVVVVVVLGMPRTRFNLHWSDFNVVFHPTLVASSVVSWEIRLFPWNENDKYTALTRRWWCREGTMNRKRVSRPAYINASESTTGLSLPRNPKPFHFLHLTWVRSEECIDATRNWKMVCFTPFSRPKWESRSNELVICTKMD